MNLEQQKMAQQMLGEWAITNEIPKVVNTFRRYLSEYAPEQVASLNEAAATDWFTKRLKYGHFLNNH